MIHLQYDVNIKVDIWQNLTAMIKNALFIIGIDYFTKQNSDIKKKNKILDLIFQQVYTRDLERKSHSLRRIRLL